MMIPDETIEQVRDSADIVHVVGEFVDLKRTGADFRGPCPFHGGRSRNLAVIPKKQIFYCFVCHEGGDVFTFFMKHLGMDYPTAVREVAGKVGVVIPERPSGGPDPREPLFSAVSIAAEWYAARLREGKDADRAREYLAGRGVAPETCNVLGLGFAPKGPVFLEHMATLGIAEDVLLEAGLAVRREDGSLRPRFWGRLLFPIHDLRGRVVGFGGRVLGDGEPKYLNSPDSRIFHKGQLLYNLHHARPAIRRQERAVVVEGYFDVLRAVEAGIDYVVAPLGTALTTEQAALLKRYTTEVVLLYDSDAAGLRASFRAADEVLRASGRALIATPPAGEDPDSLVVKGGAAALEAVLEDALDVLERKLQMLERKGWMGTLAGRRRALDRLLPTLRAAADPVTRDMYVTRTAESLGITAESVRREIGQGPSRTFDRVTHAPDVGGAPPRMSGKREKEILFAAVHAPLVRSGLRDALPPEVNFTEAERALFDFVVAQPDDIIGHALCAGLSGPELAVLQQVLQMAFRKDMDIGALLEASLTQIQGRTRDAAIKEIKDNISLASKDEKNSMFEKQVVLVKERNRENPRGWKLS